MENTFDLKRRILSYFIFLKGYENKEHYLDDYRASVFKLDGELGVMFDIHESKMIDERFNAVRIRTSSFSIDGSTPSVKLVLSTRRTEQGFLEKFSMVCAEFVNLGENGSNRLSICNDPFGWYRSWAEVMGTKTVNRTPAAVIAELITLDHLLQSGENPEWEGASSGLIDIRTEKGDYEVKSSTTRDSNIIHVSSERQLIPAGKPLHLIYCCFQKSESGIAIDDVADRLESHGFPRDGIESGLDSLGYSRGKISRYERYELVKMWEFDIDDSFPRIVPESFIGGQLPLNVTEFSYSIELSGIPHREIEYRLASTDPHRCDYAIPRKWIENKLRKGRTAEELKSIVTDAIGFSTLAENEGWPDGTIDEWFSLIDDAAGIDRCTAWESFLNRIDDGKLDKSILERNCTKIADELNTRSKTDGCVRMMVHSPQSLDSMDVVSGVMDICADSGWNLFVFIADNYRYSVYQAIDRICKNNEITSDSYAWQLLDAYRKNLSELDHDILQIDGISRSRFVIACMRQRKSISRLYNWLMGCNKKESVRLLIIDYRVNMRRPVARSCNNEMMIGDELVDKLSGYTDACGDDKGGFLSLGYVSFVPNAFHLLMNEQHLKRNPVDSFHSMLPMRPYFNSSNLFMEKTSPFLNRTETGIDILPLNQGRDEKAPSSLKEAVCWFICTVAIANRSDGNWIPYMFVMCSPVKSHTEKLNCAIRSYLNSNPADILADCRTAYIAQTKKVNMDCDAIESYEYPSFEEISSEIYRVLNSDEVVVTTDDSDSNRTEYVILENPTILINCGSYFMPSEASRLTSLYHVTAYNSRDVSISPGPWCGNYDGNAHLLRVWMSNRVADHFATIAECDELLCRSAESNLHKVFHNTDERIDRLLKGRGLRWDPCDRYDEVDHVCDLCGKTIPSGTIYHDVAYNGEQRCLECYRTHADRVMDERYGYLDSCVAHAERLFLQNGVMTPDQLDEMTHSRKKSADVLKLIKSDGYRFIIDENGDYVLIWAPRLPMFVDAVKSGASASEIISEYGDGWLWYAKHIPSRKGITMMNGVRRDESGLEACMTMLKEAVEDIPDNDVGYADIAFNDGVYNDVCSRIRSRVFEDLILRVLDHCHGVEFVSDSEIMVNDRIMQFSIYSSIDEMPDDIEGELSIIVDDDVEVITPDDVMKSFEEYFDVEPEFKGHLDYISRLKGEGF